MIKKSFYDRLSVTSPVDENRLPKSQLKDIQAAVINQKEVLDCNNTRNIQENEATDNC